MKIKMNLLSNTIFSSGEGVGNIVDIDIVYDELGIPYIPSKRIKGVLREYGYELACYGEISEESFYRIFGKKGEIESSLKLDNGYIKNYEDLAKWIKEHKEAKFLKPEFVSRYFTYEISQTAIEDGIAKEDSLRTFKTLKKGLEFYFDIDLDDDLIDDFEKILKVARHFGLSRSRGFGHVSMKLLKGSSNKAENLISDSVLSSNFQIKFKSLLPLMFYDPSYGNNISLDYIPGSSLNGFFAAKYLKKYGLDDDFYDIFIEGKVKFGNCYKDGSFPTPFCLVRKKDSENEIFDLSREEDILEISKGIQTKEFPSRFIRIENTVFQPVEVNKLATYHHARPEDKKIGSPYKNGGEFFQFEVIDKGQYFVGSIKGEEKYLSKLHSLIEKKSNQYIGKSKTAQYGKVKVYGKYIDDKKKSFEWKKGESLIFYCKSDVILLNKYGFNSLKPKDFLSEIKSFFNKSELYLKSAFVNEKIVGGFLSVWKMTKIQKLAISAGSVFRIENRGESFNVPTEIFLGMRQSEGFGEILIGKKLEDVLKSEVVENEKEGKKDGDLKDRMPPEIAKMKAEYYLDEKIDEVLEELQSSSLSNKVSNNFLGKMMTIILEANNFDEVNGFMNSFKEKAKEQLKSVREYIFVEGQSVNKDEFMKIFDENLLIYISNELFDYYRRYALTVLRQIMYNNKMRGEA